MPEILTGSDMGALIKPGKSRRSSACATVMNDKSSAIKIRT